MWIKHRRVWRVGVWCPGVLALPALPACQRLYHCPLFMYCLPVPPVPQGTLYPDVIESCPPPGSGQKHSHTIKSHHNVGGLPEDLQFELIEPLRELFKVRFGVCCSRGVLLCADWWVGAAVGGLLRR